MIIKRNTHAPFRLPRILINPESLCYEVEFTESCRYRFGTKDDADVNKLFGIAFITSGSFWFVLKNLFNGKLKALHHYNSIRLGWRYNSLSGRIELLEYCYTNGKRSVEYICAKNIGELHSFGLFNFLDYDWSFNGHSFYEMPNTWLCYELHPYFGGNNPAPHDMEIKMKRI